MFEADAVLLPTASTLIRWTPVTFITQAVMHERWNSPDVYVLPRSQDIQLTGEIPEIFPPLHTGNVTGLALRETVEKS